MFRRRFGTYASPWGEMERMRREMDRLFSTSPAYRLNPAPAYPAMNVWTNQDGAVVTAEVPGIDTEALNISVVGNTLTVSGNRTPYELREGETYHRRERGSGNFTRSFELPFGIEPGGVEAVYEKGVLQITLPRAEADKPRRIAIKAG